MDKQKIIEAVKGGMSYGEAAAEFGTTRNAVAGICHRAGVKVGPRPEKCREAVSAALRRHWERIKPEDRPARLEKAWRGRQSFWDRLSDDERSQRMQAVRRSRCP